MVKINLLNFVVCEDTKDLYGWTFSQHLPVGRFKWPKNMKLIGLMQTEFEKTV